MRRSFFNKVGGVKPDPNITFGGLGGSILTPEQFVENTTLTTDNIKNWVDDGTDLYLNIDTKFYLESFGSLRNSPTATQTTIAENITSIDDYTGLITAINTNTLYNSAGVGNLIDFNFQGLTSIGKEGFFSVRLARSFYAPILQSLGAQSMSYFGTSNGGIPINVHFPLLKSTTSGISWASYLAQCNFNFTGTSPLMTGTVGLFRNYYNTLFPFPNATSWTEQAFRECREMTGNIEMLNATGNQRLLLVFSDLRKIDKIIIPNVEGFYQAGANNHIDADVLNELDVRSLKNLYEGTDTSTIALDNDFIRGATPKSTLLVQAHIDMKTYGTGGTVQTTFANVIAAGGTVNWWNDDGTFNSTN